MLLDQVYSGCIGVSFGIAFAFTSGAEEGHLFWLSRKRATNRHPENPYKTHKRKKYKIFNTYAFKLLRILILMTSGNNVIWDTVSRLIVKWDYVLLHCETTNFGRRALPALPRNVDSEFASQLDKF